MGRGNLGKWQSLTNNAYSAGAIALLFRADVKHNTPKIIGSLGLKSVTDQVSLISSALTSICKVEYKPKWPCLCECFNIYYINWLNLIHCLICSEWSSWEYNSLSTNFKVINHVSFGKLLVFPGVLCLIPEQCFLICCSCSI